jgi:hypothetical protein
MGGEFGPGQDLFGKSSRRTQHQQQSKRRLAGKVPRGSKIEWSLMQIKTGDGLA